MGCGRTAPSTTGYPHPGTVMSALLAWLYARHHGQRFFLRLEDLDLGRSRPAYVSALRHVFAWLGLDLDATQLQSEHAERHEAALDGLADRGLLYACWCSRQRLRGLPFAQGDIGTAAYDNHCRTPSLRALSRAQWRLTPATVRLALAGVKGAARTPSSAAKSTSSAPTCHFLASPGDPIVRRRDGSVGYGLAAVVDDAAEAVTHVVRGQDLAAHVPLHRQIYACLNVAPPLWLHHPLLYSGGPDKLSKTHASVPIDPAAPPCTPGWLLGQLGFVLQLLPAPEPTTAAALLQAFAWQKLPPATEPLRWRPRVLGR